jgi:hypothetical protein
MMQKLMFAAVAATFLVAFAGCDQESGAKKETTVKTEGGETKKTEEVKVEKSGDHKDAGAAKDTATSPAI